MILFKSGEVYIEKNQCLIFPKYYFNLFFEKYLNNFDDDKNFLFFKKLIEFSKIDSFLFYSQLNQNKIKSKKSAICSFLNFINNFGLNTVELKYFSFEKIIFSIQTNTFDYSSKKEKYSTSCILFAFIYNFLIFLFKKRILFNRTFSNKNIFFTFYLFNNNSLINKRNSLIDLFNKEPSYDFKNLYEIKEKIENLNTSKKTILRNSLISKIIVNDLIVKNQKEIKIWNIPINLLPIYFLFNFFSNENFKIAFLKKIAINQGSCSAIFQKKVFGFNNRSILFKTVLEQSQVFGFGEVIFNLDSNQFNIKNNLITLQNCLNFDKSNINFYFSYFILGVFSQIYNTNCNLIKISESNFKITLKKQKIKEENSNYSKINFLLK